MEKHLMIGKIDRDSIKKIFRSPWPFFVIRLILGSVFIYAGFTKIIDPKAFAKVISHYDIIPEILLAPFAVGLPVIELLAGFGLMFNVRGSLPVVLALLTAFTVVLGYGIYNNLNIDCGCFSWEDTTDRNNLKSAFYRDLVMLTGAFLLFLSGRLYSSKNKQRTICAKQNQ
jgi:uncharacterized membrane protein YphA (DoxX/SURF4 family)